MRNTWSRSTKIKTNNILLTVTGSVAAYKAVELLRLFKKEGYRVRVVITRGGEKFITPFAFKSAGAEEVYTDDNQFETISGSSIHLFLSKWADAIIIAPASADIIAKASSGIADSLILTILLATKDPVYVFPCMNEKMFTNSVTQRNIKYLKETGYIVLEPKEGQMADLEVGKGRLPEPKEIFNFVIEHMRSNKPLKGKRILVTAGATKEFIDPVRFISNGSSGRMGISIAKKAKIMGASVCLIHGEVSIAIPPVDEAIKVSTTEEMFREVKSEFKSSDILIMAAAPSDFKPATYYKSKIPKKPNLTLKLSATVDILEEISREKGNKILVGFALQTEEIEKKAMEKMKEKNLDFIVANSEKNIGKEEGSVIFFSKSGKKKSLENKSKDEIASELLEFIFGFTEGGSNGNK